MYSSVDAAAVAYSQQHRCGKIRNLMTVTPIKGVARQSATMVSSASLKQHVHIRQITHEHTETKKLKIQFKHKKTRNVGLNDITRIGLHAQRAAKLYPSIHSPQVCTLLLSECSLVSFRAVFFPVSVILPFVVHKLNCLWCRQYLVHDELLCGTVCQLTGAHQTS